MHGFTFALMFSLLLGIAQIPSILTGLGSEVRVEEQEGVSVETLTTSNITFLISSAPVNAYIGFDGKNYTNGQSDLFTAGNYTAKVPPKSVSFPQTPNCTPCDFFLAGLSFSGWTTKGNLTIVGSNIQDPTTMRVGGVGPGNLTAKFVHADGVCAGVFSSLFGVLLGTVVSIFVLLRRRGVVRNGRVLASRA